MTVSIPIDSTGHRCSEKSRVRTLDDLITDYGPTHTISKGMDLRDYHGGDIYQYSLYKPIHVVPFNQSVKTAHKKGDIVSRYGHHYLVTEASVVTGTKTPKQPEDYSNMEYDIAKFSTWKGRYYKVPVSNNNMSWEFGNRIYFLARSSNQNCEGQYWKVYDKVGYCGCHDSALECIQNNYAWKFNRARDIKAVIQSWGTDCGPQEDTLFIKSLVKRGNYLYIRTWTEAPIEYDVTESYMNYTLERIMSPKEIEGFMFNRKTECYAAFDNKNYTIGVFTPARKYVDFEMVSTSKFDTIALGRVYGRKVGIKITDLSGKVLFSISDYPIENNIADTDIGQDANVIIYTNDVMPANVFIRVRIFAGWVRVGRILLGRKMSLGFTNTLFDNSFKDFSPKEQDQWGNIEYRNGVRIYIHSGTVELPLKDYDALNRAFMYIGGQEMIINGSDNISNTPPDSIEIFQSTMFIGRFKSFKQSTKNIGSIMDTVAGFSFSCEESV